MQGEDKRGCRREAQYLYKTEPEKDNEEGNTGERDANAAKEGNKGTVNVTNVHIQYDSIRRQRSAFVL